MTARGEGSRVAVQIAAWAALKRALRGLAEDQLDRMERGEEPASLAQLAGERGIESALFDLMVEFRKGTQERLWREALEEAASRRLRDWDRSS